MRRIHIVILAMLCGCNSIVGEGGYSLGAPDATAPAADCKVNSDFPLLSSNPQTSLLFHRMSDGGTSLLFLLNTDPKPDAFRVDLYDSMGGHNALDVQGKYFLNSLDTQYATCGICAFVETDFDSASKTYASTFMALDQGYLQVRTATTTGMAGSLHDLKFRQVETSGTGTNDVNNGCAVTIDDVEFDLTYSE